MTFLPWLLWRQTEICNIFVTCVKCYPDVKDSTNVSLSFSQRDSLFFKTFSLKMFQNHVIIMQNMEIIFRSRNIKQDMVTL